MTAKFFADSNVALYAIGKDTQKADIARRIIAGQPIISVQVVNECVNVCLRKLSFTKEQAYAFAHELMDRTDVVVMDKATIEQAATLAIRYQLSHWDALIVRRGVNVVNCGRFKNHDHRRSAA